MASVESDTDNDQSSTEEEMKRLWDKLDRIKAMGKHDNEDAPKRMFQCPSSMSSCSPFSEDDESTSDSPCTMVDLTKEDDQTSVQQSLPDLNQDWKPSAVSPRPTRSPSSSLQRKSNEGSRAHHKNDMVNSTSKLENNSMRASMGNDAASSVSSFDLNTDAEETGLKPSVLSGIAHDGSSEGCTSSDDDSTASSSSDSMTSSSSSDDNDSNSSKSRQGKPPCRTRDEKSSKGQKVMEEKDPFPYFDEDPQDTDDEKGDDVDRSSRFFRPVGTSNRGRVSGASQGSQTVRVAVPDKQKIANSDKNTPQQRPEPASREHDGKIESNGKHHSLGSKPFVEDSNGRVSNKELPRDGKIDSFCPQEYRQRQNDEKTEVDHSLYEPPLYHEKQPPILHQFTYKNRPVNSRPKIPIRKIFPPPLHLLWQSKFETFNHLQSEVANALCHSDDHVVVAAPTGAGKTAIFEMAIARFIATDLRNYQMSKGGPQHLSKKRKIVYIAPSKALCEERYVDWSQRLSRLHMAIEVVVVTGDADPASCYHDLASAHIILTTPEKWDSLSRKWSENFFLLASVKLVMIDEVHLLGDESRGFRLESIISRMKSIQRAAKVVDVSLGDLHSSSYPHTSQHAISSSMRMVAVSATLPNITDVAEFLGANEAYTFDDSYRPVPLTKHVVGLGYVGKNEYRFWSSLDRHVPEIINQFSNKKQTLVFCHTKKDTERLVAFLISNKCCLPNANRSSSAAPGTVQHCLDYGIAYHHSGMELSDRKSVEQAFACKRIHCLCATSTLAVGVNLPAHLVIIKGTKTWRGGGSGYQEIDKGSLLQMVGRAGRPGLDTSGTAVILTDNDSKASIQRLAQGLGAAESHLLPKLVDIINTEISQRVITSMEGALQWLKTTFFFVRVSRHREKYGMATTRHGIDDYLFQLCKEAIQQLCEMDLVEVDDKNIISPLPACHVMNQGMVSAEAMKLIVSLPYDSTQCQILKAISKMEPFHFVVRRHEKKMLNECHKSEVIRYKLEGPLSKVRIQKPSEKAFVLLQANIGQHSFENYTLKHEMTSMVANAQRILAAAQEYSIKGSENGHVALQCLKLRRSLNASLWDKSSGVLNQIPDIGQQCTAKMKFNGIVSFQQAMDASEEKIERASGRTSPFGKQVRSLVSRLLSENLKVAAEIEYTRGSNIAAGVLCRLQRFKPVLASSDKKNMTVTYTLIAYTDRPGTCIFFREGITGTASYHFSCPPKFGKLFIHLIASLVGMDDMIVLDGNDVTAQSSFVNSEEPRTRAMPVASTKKLSGTTLRAKQSRNEPRLKGLPQKAKRDFQTGPFAALHRAKNDQVDPSNTLGLDSATTAVKKPGNKARPATKSSTAKITPQKPATAFTPAESTNHTWPSVSPQSITQEANSTGTRLYPKGMGDSNIYSGLRNGQATNKRQINDCRFVNKTSVVSVTPIDSNGSQQRRKLDHRSSLLPCGLGISKKIQPPLHNWNKTKRKQQKAQQRAFVTKRDNPFTFFQHDPNDAESFLDGLSAANDSESSIIPSNELRAFRRQTARVSRALVPHRSNVGSTHQKRRRRITSTRPKMSNQELLRMKAAEHTLYDTFNTPQRCLQPMQSAHGAPSGQYVAAHGFDRSYHACQEDQTQMAFCTPNGFQANGGVFELQTVVSEQPYQPLQISQFHPEEAQMQQAYLTEGASPLLAEESMEPVAWYGHHERSVNPCPLFRPQDTLLHEFQSERHGSSSSCCSTGPGFEMQIMQDPMHAPVVPATMQVPTAQKVLRSNCEQSSFSNAFF